MTAADAWRAVLAGEWIVVTAVERDGRRVIVSRRKPPDVPAVPLLTEREVRMLAMRANALAIKEIAHALEVSEPTVSRMLVRAMRKLGVTCASELARFREA